VRLPLPAESDRDFVVVAAHAFAEDGVFNQQPKDHEVEMAVERCALRYVGVLEEIGCERYEAGKRLFFSLVGRKSDKVKTEQLVSVCEVVGSKQDGSLFSGTTAR